MTNKKNTSPVNTLNQTKVPKEKVVEEKETTAHKEVVEEKEITAHKEDRDREVQARRQGRGKVLVQVEGDRVRVSKIKVALKGMSDYFEL